MSNNIKNSAFKNPAIKIFTIILLIAVAIIPQTGCSNKEPVSKTDFCLNTTCEISIYGMSKVEAEDMLTEAFKEIRSYENTLSKTVEGSDVYKINNAAGQPVRVSDDTIAVMEEGMYMGDISDGRFDITIGKVTDLWNFTGENPAVPEQADIDEALPAVDYSGVNINGNNVSLDNPETRLDLGGIAKGYIADRIGDFLQAKGVSEAIINLGGNVVALGEKSEDTPWRIGVERPYSNRTELAGFVEAVDATLVTSGIYERKFEQDGVLYHHILDPNTGYPAETDLESVTILAAKGNSCFIDGLSTTCLMLGKEKAMELIKQLQKKYPDMRLEAAFIDKNDDMVQTDGMNIQTSED